MTEESPPVRIDPSHTGRAQLNARLEAQLVRRAQSGDRDARNQLVVALQPFVRWIANEHRASQIELEDLIQEGTLGLIAAIERFDPSRGLRLTTFAKQWIEGEVRRAARESSIIRLPAAKAALLGRIGQAEDRLRSDLGREPTPAEVAVFLGLDERDIVDAAEVTRAVVLDDLVELEASARSALIDELSHEQSQTYSREEVESILQTYAEHRGRLEGAKSPDQPTRRVPRSAPSQDLHARLLDLEGALERLPDPQYEAVEVVAFYGLGFEEAGAWLAVHPNTVRNRYRGAVTAVIRHLNGVELLPERRRTVAWVSELSPIESLKLVIRKYDALFEELATLDEQATSFLAQLEVGWVQLEGEGWVPIFSQDVRETARRMRRGVRPLPEG